MTTARWYQAWRSARERAYDALVNAVGLERKREMWRFRRACEHMALASLRVVRELTVAGHTGGDVR